MTGSTGNVNRADETAQTMRNQLGLTEVRLANMWIAAITEADLTQLVVDELDSGRGGWIITMNLDILRQCDRDLQVATLCSRARIRVADGMPLVWAARLQGTRIPERVAGSNIIVSLSRQAAESRRTIFLLGGDPGAAEAAAAVLRDKFKGLQVSGTLCPPLGFEGNASCRHEIEAALEAAKPDIVYVALGFPKQERLINRLLERFPGTWWIGVGISFSFLGGQVQRAPVWMQRGGLEWVHRLVQEPRRLARRYLVDDIPFAMRLLAGSSWKGARRRADARRRQDPASGADEPLRQDSGRGIQGGS